MAPSTGETPTTQKAPFAPTREISIRRSPPAPRTERKLDVFSDHGAVEGNRDGSAVLLGGVDGGELVR